MILVADSGSSSSDWMLNLPDSKPLFFKTKGLNPFFVSEKEIEKVMKDVPEIIPYSNEIKEVYFFGAGSITPDCFQCTDYTFSQCIYLCRIRFAGGGLCHTER